MTRTELELNSYVHHLEEHLRLTVFGRGVADPEAAVLLVRGALAADDQARAAELAAATVRMTAHWPDDRDTAAAVAHVRGLVEQDPAAWNRQVPSTPPRWPGPGRPKTLGWPWPSAANTLRR